MISVDTTTYQPDPPPPVIENVTITLDPNLAKRLAVVLYYTTSGNGELDTLGFKIRNELNKAGYGETSFEVADPASIRALKAELGDLLASEWSVLREVMRDHMGLEVRVA